MIGSLDVASYPSGCAFRCLCAASEAGNKAGQRTGNQCPSSLLIRNASGTNQWKRSLKTPQEAHYSCYPRKSEFIGEACHAGSLLERESLILCRQSVFRNPLKHVTCCICCCVLSNVRQSQGARADERRRRACRYCGQVRWPQSIKNSGSQAYEVRCVTRYFWRILRFRRAYQGILHPFLPHPLLRWQGLLCFCEAGANLQPRLWNSYRLSPPIASWPLVSRSPAGSCGKKGSLRRCAGFFGVAASDRFEEFSRRIDSAFRRCND